MFDLGVDPRNAGLRHGFCAGKGNASRIVQTVVDVLPIRCFKRMRWRDLYPRDAMRCGLRRFVGAHLQFVLWPDRPLASIPGEQLGLHCAAAVLQSL
jgi:hypothetical protein